MKRFVCNVLLAACLACILLVVPAAGRVMRRQGQVKMATSLSPSQKFLFVGDSHVGCDIVEAEAFSNRVLWASSEPPQIDLMRLRDLAERGALKDVEAVIVEVGFQRVAQQERAKMLECLGRLLPVTWRHVAVMSVPFPELLFWLLTHPGYEMQVAESRPDNNVSCQTWTEEKRRQELASKCNSWFGWIGQAGVLCRDWETSLKESYREMAGICRQNGIRMICFTAPLSARLRQSVPQEAKAKLAEIVDYVRSLGVPYHDLQDWGEEDDFRDSDHLRAESAVRFSKWFFQQAIRLQ